MAKAVNIFHIFSWRYEINACSYRGPGRIIASNRYGGTLSTFQVRCREIPLHCVFCVVIAME